MNNPFKYKSGPFILEQFGKKFRLLLKHKLKTNQQKSQGRKWYLGQFHKIIIIIIIIIM